MLKKYICLGFLLFSSLSFGMTQNISQLGFEAVEHAVIGDEVVLLFSESDARVKTKLRLSNGLYLTYGEIVSLAGDFYGVPEAPIMLGKTLSEKRQRFMQAYNSLALDPQAVFEEPKIMAIIQDEQKQLQEGMQRGEKPIDIYAKMAIDHNMDWNCITGGLCENEALGITRDKLRKIYFLKQGRYLKLAITDHDHFGEDAYGAYEVGHQLAVETAILAKQTQNISLLDKAYSINAFACHYLSDGFAAGHMRTPRYFLSSQVTPSTVGSLLANYMHREDGELGLWVTNKRGNAWKAYGDGYYFDDRNRENRAALHEAMQSSANHVYLAYREGNASYQDTALLIAPDLHKLLEQPQSENNSSPLFFWDNKTHTLLRRTQINSSITYKWTSKWLGWETLIELINAHGIPHEDRAKLLADESTNDRLTKALTN